MRQVVEVMGAGVTTSLLGKPVLEETLPYHGGVMGHLATTSSVDLMTGCDTLLIVVSNDPWTEYYPKPGQARAVQIDTAARTWVPRTRRRSSPRCRSTYPPMSRPPWTWARSSTGTPVSCGCPPGCRRTCRARWPAWAAVCRTASPPSWPARTARSWCSPGVVVVGERRHLLGGWEARLALHLALLPGVLRQVPVVQHQRDEPRSTPGGGAEDRGHARGAARGGQRAGRRALARAAGTGGSG